MCGQIAFSQTKTVSGTVLDDTGTPLPGASVVVKGTSNGTQTDFDGNFTISASNNDTLTISYIGFVSQSVIVGNQTTIKIQLNVDSTQLDEIVVVGYGSQSRAEVTGAISSVKSSEINALPVSNAAQALQGRAAGVSVVSTGTPGTEPSITVRGLGSFGDNSPLFVVDGVIVGNLSGINQNDIESINVLKDASTTAVYGSQGSNGVVMVTTKKGISGKTKLSLNVLTGFQKNNNRYDVLNTEQYLQYANDAFGIVPNTPLSSSGINTNWQDEIYTTGLIRDYNFAASGGGENSNFRISGGYAEQEGVVIETGFERYSFRGNSNFDIGKLTIGQTLSLAFNRQKPDPTGVGGRSLLEHAIKAAPYLPVYNPDNLGGFQGPNSAGDGQDAENPVRILKLGSRVNKSVNIIGNIFANYEIIEGLNFKTQFGLDYYNFNNDSFIPSFNDDSLGGTHQQAFAAITKNSGTGQTLIFTNSLTYNTSINDSHNFEALVLAEKFGSKGSSVNVSSRNAVSDEVQQVSDEDSSVSSNSFEYNRYGFLGRLNYNYKDKYIAAISYRRDGSARFGKNNKWGSFSSYALGWNIAKENFLVDSNISTLKLRGSLGLSGNDRTQNYATDATLVSDFLYPINGSNAVGTTSLGLENLFLKWEETEQINVGLDVGLFNEKFTAAIEYYKNSSSDLLLDVPPPNSLGLNLPNGVVGIPQNAGSIETTGFEVSLGYNDFEGDFTWSANLNLATSSSKALSLGSVSELNGGVFESNPITRVTPGESLFYMYGLEMDGIYQTPAEVAEVFTGDPGQTTVQVGDVRYVDQLTIDTDGDLIPDEGDGVINSEDRVKIGDPLPDLTFGLNLSGEYKRFDFNVFFTGILGRDLYNTNIYDLEGMPRLFNAGTSVLDRWTTTNPSNTIPRAGGAPQNTAISSRFVEDGSFTRLKNLTIGYTLPTDTFGGDVFSKFRVYLSGQNLITITDYSGLDPEVGNGSLFEFGIDRGAYPQPKTYLVGLQVSF